jgi:hypothetical protein
MNILKEGTLIKGQRKLANELLNQMQSELARTLQEIKPRAEKGRTKMDSTIPIRGDRER